jgi:hypothetical protein
MTPRRHPGLGVFRASRPLTVGLFLTLLLVAVVERRLADVHYTVHSLGTLDVGFYDEAIEGDEVALRLVALDDASPPFVAAPASPLARLCPALVCAEIAPRPIESPAPRGPPPGSSALV